MIPELPDEAYLRWLYQQVARVSYRDPSRTYWSLLKQLYTTEFVWLVPNDDNRVEDGRDLRVEFIQQSNFPHVTDEWMGMGCSMLEMLIALSRRLSFEADREPRAWFWHLLRNIQLDNYTDDKPDFRGDVEESLNRVIWRTYDKNGHGGLFPLEHSDIDQTKVELWYQLSAYLTQ